MSIGQGKSERIIKLTRELNLRITERQKIERRKLLKTATSVDEARLKMLEKDVIPELTRQRRELSELKD